MSEYKDGRCVGQFRATDREDVEIILTAAGSQLWFEGKK